MATAWYIVPYKRRPEKHPPVRYPAIDDYTPQIYGAGGRWAETEILGNRCLVKVRAPDEVLAVLDGAYKRLPAVKLDRPLARLPAKVKQALKDELEDIGYSPAEIQARFPRGLGDCTLRDVLRFMATRRLKPRWDRQADEIVLDGQAQACRPVDEVDREVA